jgi:hypothetical protein
LTRHARLHGARVRLSFGKSVELEDVTRPQPVRRPVRLLFTAETLDTYSHLWPDSEDRTRLAVDEVLGSEPAADSLRTGDAR